MLHEFCFRSAHVHRFCTRLANPSNATLQLCGRSLRVDAVSVVDLTDYVITKAPNPSSLLPNPPPLPSPPPPPPPQEQAKAGKAWKDDFVSRPVSTPFALKSAMVHSPPPPPALSFRDSPAKTKRTKRINSHSQQAELVKKTHVTSPDTVEKDSGKAATPVSPRAKQEPEALPVKARAAEKQSIFEQAKMKRSAKDFDNLKVRGRI